MSEFVSQLDIGKAAEAEVFECRRSAAGVLESRDSEVRAAFRSAFAREQAAIVNDSGTALAMLSVFIYRLPENEPEKIRPLQLLHAAINFQLLSFKLFMSGHTVASGALFRHAIEGVSLAFLGSVKSLTHLRRFEGGSYNANKAVKDLELNAKKANINTHAIKTLSAAYRSYHRFAHLSTLTIAASANFSAGGRLHLGAFFDPEKLSGYQKEVRSRVSFARVLPNVVRGVCKNIALWDAPRGTGAGNR